MSNQPAVHYIWMGNWGTEEKRALCSLGPTSLARYAPENPIFLWLPESLLEEATQLFSTYPAIQLCSVDKFLREEQELKYIKEHAPAILNLLERMKKKEKYSFQKDLMSFAIIAERGGYFFDCTTCFYDEPSLPPIEDFKIILPKNVIDGQCGKIGQRTPFITTDLWVFGAGEPGKHLFLDALKFMLEKNDENATGSQGYLYQLNRNNNRYKQRGLSTIAWPFTSPASGYNYEIPTLKLRKYFAGTWRRKYNELPTGKNANTNTYETLGLFTLRMKIRSDRWLAAINACIEGNEMQAAMYLAERYFRSDKTDPLELFKRLKKHPSFDVFWSRLNLKGSNQELEESQEAEKTYLSEEYWEKAFLTKLIQPKSLSFPLEMPAKTSGLLHALTYLVAAECYPEAMTLLRLFLTKEVGEDKIQLLQCVMRQDNDLSKKFYQFISSPHVYDNANNNILHILCDANYQSEVEIASAQSLTEEILNRLSPDDKKRMLEHANNYYGKNRALLFAANKINVSKLTEHYDSLSGNQCNIDSLCSNSPFGTGF